MGLSRSDYLQGLVFFAPTLLACVAAAVAVTWRRFGGLGAAPAATAIGLLASAAVFAAHLLPLALGVMTRGTVLLAAVLLLALALALARERTGAGPPPASPPASDRWSWAVAGAALGLVAVWGCAYLVSRSGQPVIALDALNSHFPQSARWIQSGTAWQLDQFNVDFQGSTYPDNGNLMQLVVILPWRSLFAVRYAGVPFLLLTAVAVYAIGLELRAPRATAALAAAAIVALPAVAGPALQLGQVDPPMYAWLAAGVLFLLRFARHGRTPELVLAGIGLGLAFGTKWYAVADVPLIVVIWAAALLAAGRAPRAVARQVLLVGGVVLLAGGFWLLRNWVEAGDPFHPVVVRAFGVTIFDSPPDPFRKLAGFSIAHYAADFGVWRHYLLPALLRQLGWAAAAVALAALAGGAWAAAGLRRRASPDAARVAVLAVAAIGMAVVYTLLPFTAFGLEGRPLLAQANVRYVVPALLVAAPLAAWAIGRARRARLALELVLLAAIVDSARRAFPGVAAGDVARGIAVLVVAAALAAGVVWLAMRASTRRPAPAVALAAIVVLAIAVGGAELRSRAGGFAYGNYDPALRVVDRDVTPPARIGLAGVWSTSGVPPVAPAFGPRLRNEVATVAHLERGSMTAYRTRAGFTRALRRGRYNALIVGTGAVPQPPASVREVKWAQQAGFAPITASRRLVVMLARKGS